jgi:thiol-disulfide isomerase/thioredoxin
MNRFGCFAAALAGAALLTGPASAAPEGWTTDYDQAKSTAAEQGKDLLLDFTGSDWCGWCIRLKDEVFLQPAFKDAAPDDFVMVELDFPQDKPQSDELKQQNQRLAEKFDVGGYPTIVLADAEGRPYAMTGYREGGADAYLAHLDELQQVRAARDEAMQAADSAEGLKKAKALDDAMTAVGMDLAVGHYRDTVETIVDLDADNEAGLKAKYEAALQNGKLADAVAAVINQLQTGDFESGLAELEQVIDRFQPEGEQKQMLYGLKGQVLAQMGQMDAAVDALNTALESLPDSPIAPQIRQLNTQIKAATPPPTE